MKIPMRKADRRISDEETLEILKKGIYGILSMCAPSGEAYGIPLNYVIKGREIYFHCAMQGSKLDFLKNNNKASFCVVGKAEIIPDKFSTRYESVIASGITSLIDGEEKREALIKLVEKYSPDFIREGVQHIDKNGNITAVFKLSIENITGKSRK
jgi:hypothetical protein